MTSHIGIVACSAEGAALCYRTLCAEGARLMGAYEHPEVSLHTHSLAEYVKHLDRGDWQGVGGLMLSSAHKLARAGADVLICPDNTIHRAFSYVEPRSPLPWLHIAEVVAEHALERGFRRLGITGTRWLVESEVYPEMLASRGLAYVRPDPAELEEIQRIIMDELVYGVFKPEAAATFERVIGRMQQQGCDAVVLGCTEIPLIMNDSNSPLPTLDSTRLLARAALHEACEDQGEARPACRRRAAEKREGAGDAGVPSVKRRDLEDAFMWVSAAPMYTNQAYIDRASGKTYRQSELDDFFEEEEIPEGLGDPDRYIEVPHKNELDLGRVLALKFVAEKVPNRYDEVAAFYRRRSAYARFKDLLESEGVLEQWYEYENEATERALREWCALNGIRIVED